MRCTLFCLILVIGWNCKAEIPCGEKRIGHALEMINQRILLARGRIKIYQEDLKELGVIEDRAVGTASIASGFAAVGAAAAVLAGAVILAPIAEIGLTSSAIVTAKTAGGAAYLAGESAFYFGSAQYLGNSIGSWMRTNKPLEEAKKLPKNQKILTTFEVEQMVDKFTLQLSQDHSKIEEISQKEKDANPPKWWTFGWDDAGYVSAQMRGWEAHLDLFKEELKTLEQMKKTLSPMCSNFPSSARHKADENKDFPPHINRSHGSHN